MDWFENWFGSPYYKILYANRDDREAQEFVENLLGFLQPPAGSTMVDIACGEGRFARQLAEHGFDITGIDISHGAIEFAKAFEDEHLHFMVQDMRMPFYINYFDYALNFFTSFGYFKTSRGHKQAASAFAGSLKKGGTLVIDYLNLEYVVAHLIKEETIVRGSYTFKLKKRVDKGHIIKDIHFNDADDKPRVYSELVAAFRLHDFINMFQEVGMTMTHTFGDYKLNHYDETTSPRMIMVFKKN